MKFRRSSSYHVKEAVMKISRTQCLDIFIIDQKFIGTHNLIGGICGPFETPYEGGIFYISVTGSKETLPKDEDTLNFEFMTKIIHPNINNEGKIILNTPDWHYDIKMGLRWIIKLLKEPNWDASTNLELKQMYDENPEAYFSYVRDATIKYAT